MSNYTKTTDFEVKDGLTTGDPAKAVKGTEIEAEFDAIATAIATKSDSASPTFTGTPVFPTPFTIGATSMTATAAELNILDGATVTTAELNILDGVTATAAELNILDGVTSTAAELNLLDGVTTILETVDLTSDVTGVLPAVNGGLPVHAYGRVTSAGSLVTGSYGVTSVSNPSTGAYDVTLSSALTNYTRAIVLVGIAVDPDITNKDTVYFVQGHLIDSTSIEVFTVLLSWVGALTASASSKDFNFLVLDAS